MRTRYSFLFLGVLSLFFACTSPTEKIPEDEGTNYQTKTFWTINYQKSVSSLFVEQINAKLLAEGSYCRVWADVTSGVSEETAKNMAYTYDTNIHSQITGAFGFKKDISIGGTVVRNSMEYAGWMMGGDGKLVILLMDIKDGFNGSTNQSYIAGYFTSINFMEYVEGDYGEKYYVANKCPMIYVDTYPGKAGSKESNATVAHELQHLLNYVNSEALRDRRRMDEWINEGLSAAAEWVYSKEYNEERRRWFNEDPTGLVSIGNNFFVWGNHSENPYAVMDDYATVYLFFQWLRLQTGGTGIYNKIAVSSKSNYEAVTAAAGYNDDWETLLKDWLAANYINSPGGDYGYKGAIETVPKMIASSEKQVNLYPGEGVYSAGNGSSLPPEETYIKYAGLKKGEEPINAGSVPEDGALLTFNANRNNLSTTGADSGTITGVTVTASVNTPAAAMSRFALSAEPRFKWPFAVSAADVLRRNGLEGKPLRIIAPSDTGDE